MAKPSAVDYALIQCLLQEDHEKQEKQPHASSFISILVAWIAGSAPPSSPADYRQDLQTRRCMEKLFQTTPPSFAIAFLEYLRTESETVSEAQSDSESEKTEQASSIQNASSTTSSAPPEEANKTKVAVSRTAPIKTPAKPKENSYDAEFPVLGGSNTHVSQKSTQLQIRPKRRVNPTPMENPVVDSAFVLAKVESRNPSNNSIPRTRSSAPLKIDMDILMQRCDDKRKLKPRTVETANCSLNQLCVTGQNQCISLEDGVAFTGSTKNVLRSSVVPNSTVLKLKRFANVHSKLISEKMVPSLIGELQHLFQLLSLGQSSKQQCGKDSSEKKLFGCGDDCSLYACIVMEQLGRVLDSVGEPLLLALINHPVIAQLSPALLMRMKESLVSHQATALHSFKSYKISNAQNAHSQSADIGMPVSLPFQAARDSRNHYKSRESQKLYNNRELSRDYFYAIIRDAASAQNSFGYTVDNSRLKTQESVKSLMNNLSIENYPWFTELFLEQFVQVAMCGETDPVVTGLARQDPMKLQRLHDRLTLGHRNKAASSLVPLSLGHKANNIVDPKGSVKVLKSSSQILSDVKPEKANLAGMELTSFFPPSLRVYVWIMEAADSYRLSMQMIWSLKSKICKLTEIPQHSRDAAEIGSLLTQRVLSLKALSGLIGFLCFFPGAGSSSQGFEEWEIRRTEPPIDVVETLEKAIISETMLLTLPWVLDFLRFIKADQYAVSLPYFQKALSALRNVYNYSILDPKSDSFGVPSICILASLDRFFEFMDLPAWDINVHHSVIEPGKIHRFAEDNGCMLDTKTSCGLDRIIGVVDASYIQQCCPTLMELRLLLTESERQSKNSNSASKSNGVHVKALRKITPVHHPKNSQIFDRASSCGLENVPTSLDNFIHVKLQQSFFEQRQELQRLVDFVVDTTAVNAARAASLRCVPPILEEALRKLQVAFAHKFQGSMDKEGESQQESQVEAVVENIITSSIQEALSPAMEYAKNHTAERTSEALAVLAGPDESPFALGIAARIAADAAGSAACKKTLANISCDIRKHITQEVESWRQSSQNILKYDARVKQLQEMALSACGASRAFNVTPQLHNIFGGGKENIKSSCDFSQEKRTVLKQSTFYENDTDSVEKNHTVLNATDELSETIAGSTGVLVQPPCSWENESYSLLDRALHCCAGVVECCADFALIDNRRHLLRVKLAAVCTSIETMLSLECGQLPLGGFDAIVHSNINSKDPSLSFELGKVTDVATSYTKEAGAEARFIVERGLARRCVALALYLCLQSPLEAFGYNPEALGECTCLSISNSQYVNKLVVTAELNGALCKLLKDDKSRELEIFIEKCVEPTGDSKSEKSSEGTSECRRNNRLGGLMLGLLSMWEALVKCGICQVNFFLSEFLSSWRWIQAIQPEPWKTSKFWFEALNHGIANVLLKLIYMTDASNNVEKPVYTLLESFFTDFFQKKHNVSRKLVALDELNTKMENLRRLVACILLEVIYLQAWQGHTPDKFEIDQNHCHQDSITRGLISVISLVEACCMNMEV